MASRGNPSREHFRERKITSGTGFRISAVRRPAKHAQPSSPPPPLDFSRRIKSYKKKESSFDVLPPPPSRRWSTNLENNRRNGIGNCSSFFFFSISNFESCLPHRRLPFELRIAFNPSRSKRLLPSLRHIISWSLRLIRGQYVVKSWSSKLLASFVFLC